MHFVAGQKVGEGGKCPLARPTIVMPLQYTNLLISACVAVGMSLIWPIPITEKNSVLFCMSPNLTHFLCFILAHFFCFNTL